MAAISPYMAGACQGLDISMEPIQDAEVADVKRPLASVCKRCEAGNRVVFDPSGSYIEHIKTGKRTTMEMQEKGTESR